MQPPQGVDVRGGKPNALRIRRFLTGNRACDCSAHASIAIGISLLYHSSAKTKTAAIETITTETSIAVSGSVIQRLLKSVAASAVTVDAAPV